MSDLCGLSEHQGPRGMTMAHCQDIHSERVELILKRVMIAYLWAPIRKLQHLNLTNPAALEFELSSVIELITEKTVRSCIKRWLRLNVVLVVD